MYIQCPKCNKIYTINESLQGQNVRCNSCNENFVALCKNENQLIKRCPICGEMILAIAQKCRYCGEYLDKHNNAIRKADRTTYTLLGLFFGCIGIHNFFAGNKEKWAGVGHIVIWIIAIVGCCMAGEFSVVVISVLSLVNCFWVLLEVLRGPED